MSINDLIEHWISEERLWRLEPTLESDPVDRCLLISSEIKQLIDGPWPDKEWEKRCNYLRAELESFVKGEEVRLCLEPYEADTAFMGRLFKPSDEVWDIRSRRMRPSLRVFGRFARRDLFVAFFWSPRSLQLPYSQRLPLGDRDSEEWRLAIKETKAEWRKLFPSFNPIHGESHDIYASNAVSV